MDSPRFLPSVCSYFFGMAYFSRSFCAPWRALPSRAFPTQRLPAFLFDYPLPFYLKAISAHWRTLDYFKFFLASSRCPCRPCVWSITVLSAPLFSRFLTYFFRACPGDQALILDEPIASFRSVCLAGLPDYDRPNPFHQRSRFTCDLP